MRGIRGIRVWRRVLGEECSERSYWLGWGAAEEEAACPPRDRPSPLRGFWMAVPFLGKQSLSGEGRGEERRGRPWRQISCVSEDPQSRRLQKAFAIRRREDQEKKKGRRRKKEKKKAHGGPSVSDLPLRRQANTFLRRTCCLKNTRLHTLIWQRGSPRPTIRYLI